MAELLLCEEEMSPSVSDATEVLDESPDVAVLPPCSPHQLRDFPPRNDAELQTVVIREGSQMPYFEGYSSALRAKTGILQARAMVVRWMLKVRNVYAFRPMTVALAVNYLDRYLSIFLPQSFQPWGMQLLSVACLSIAARMEELCYPCLLDLQVEYMIHIFENKDILKMESVVLKALGWRMQGVTAFEYVDDLLHRLNLSTEMRASMVSRITELLLGSLPEADFLAFRPSTISLTALCCALDEILPLRAEDQKALLIAALPSAQAAFRDCYRLMEDLIIDPQAFGKAKSPPSPFSVLEITQRGGWRGNAKKRKAEDEVTIYNRSDSRSKSGRISPEAVDMDYSVWDLF